MDDPSTLVVVKQNLPFKLLFVDADIAVAIGFVAFMGIATRHYVVPTIIAGSLGSYLQHLRTNYPRGYITHFFVYWLMPAAIKPLQASPPSHVREFIG